jgi:5-methylcytosine-specific restriction endonuclease McrA
VPYADPEKQKEYQREWIARRREEWFDENGPCAQCGSDEALQIDHIDREKKVDHRVWSWSKERREAELAKCQVLCGECHGKKSIDEGSVPPPTHGTDSRYRA